MFRGFNLKIDGNPFGSSDSHIRNDVQAIDDRISRTISSFSRTDGKLDGTKIKANWFPCDHADVFISHSRADRDLAIGLAGWIKHNFELTSFIDSCVWGHADKLLGLIDRTYCYNPSSETFIYKKRNLSTSHVHMMLSTALSEMIDKSECIIFLNTPRSIDANDSINNPSTHSPWIYSEISMTKLVRKHNPREVIALEKRHITEGSPTLALMYDLDLDHLTGLNQGDLRNWLNAKGSPKYLGAHNLDILYDLKKEAIHGS
ncbi:hypothetical protein ABNQ39_06820 [Azospirillum sp. A26]|uniref:hypothetical protein n=1 Tax=Azospirillum sp. A26 TaxID=3160607 RepID=UPI00366B3E4C